MNAAERTAMLDGQKRATDQRAGRISERRHRPEPVSRIVITGDHHHRHPGLCRHLLQKGIELPHGADRRRRPVKDIARDDEHLGTMVQDGLRYLIEHRLMIGVQRQAVERAAKMQISGMENFHLKGPCQTIMHSIYAAELHQDSAGTMACRQMSYS